LSKVGDRREEPEYKIQIPNKFKIKSTKLPNRFEHFPVETQRMAQLLGAGLARAWLTFFVRFVVFVVNLPPPLTSIYMYT
jgi:hypothetical protein